MIVQALLLAAFSVVQTVLASSPVYVINADGVVPANTVLDGKMTGALLAYWMGEAQRGHGQEMEVETAYEARRLFKNIPSPLMDSRNTAVVYVHGLDENEAAKVVGSPLVEVTVDSKRIPALLKDSQGQSLAAIKAIDGIEYPIASVDARTLGTEAVLTALKQLKSKVLVIKAPAETLTEKIGDYFGSYGSLLVAKRAQPTSKSPYSKANYGPYTSKDECETATDGCSGRGSCVLQPSSKAWLCQCKATKKNNYTYYWGGYNCAKRDVSAQFHLLVGSVLLLGGIFAGSIALLYNMGKDPLPGILTTGVL